MSDEMIERVAKGILLCMNNMSGTKQDVSRAAARLAIQLMRELPEDPGPRYNAGEYSRRTQEAMVDDALSVTEVLPEAQKTL